MQTKLIATIIGALSPEAQVAFATRLAELTPTEVARKDVAPIKSQLAGARAALTAAPKPKPTATKATKPVAPVVQAKASREVPESFRVAGAHVVGSACPFCAAKGLISDAAELEAHPSRPEVLRATFTGCKHRINVRQA